MYDFEQTTKDFNAFSYTTVDSYLIINKCINVAG